MADVACPFRLGLLVNPIAGLGGRVGLKGTDGPGIVALALARGGLAEAVGKGARSLSALAGLSLEIFAGGGDLGEASCSLAGLSCHLVTGPPVTGDHRDTERVLDAFRALDLDLILFTGGDGTARLVAVASGGKPMLGIPAGVKMYSGVFALSPAAAGLAVAEHVAAHPAQRQYSEAEVLDLDETSPSDPSRLSLFGTAKVPATTRLQRAKTSPPQSAEADLEALARQIAAECRGNDVVILGPGTTTMRVKSALGIEGTLLGVDAVRHGRLIATDASEAELLALVAESVHSRIVVGVLGGLGALFGRGNQQIAPAVLRRVGRDNIMVISSAAKLATLPSLFLDTGDEELDRTFAGHWRIRTAPRRDSVMRVVAG